MSSFNENKKYYAVSGIDGFGIYTYLRGAQRIAAYIKEATIVQCNSMQQAFCMARDNYNDYQIYGGVDDAFYGDSLDIKLNEVMFRSNIRNKNRAESPCTSQHRDSHIYG